MGVSLRFQDASLQEKILTRARINRKSDLNMVRNILKCSDNGFRVPNQDDTGNEDTM